MKTLKKVEVKPIFVIGFMPDFSEMQQDFIYISKQYETAVHRCLCGCGEKVITPIHKLGWNLIEQKGNVSLSPSIGNYSFACKSHYIITNNIANFV